MFVPQGCNDDTAVVESFKEALRQRVGAERYQLWFTHGVEFSIGESRDERSDLELAGTAERERVVIVRVRGQFALDRIRNHWIRELRGAAMQAHGTAGVEICLDQPVATQAELPLPGLERPSHTPESHTPESHTPKSGRTESGRAESGSVTSDPNTVKGNGEGRRNRRTRNQRSAASRGKTRSLHSLVDGGAGAVKTKRRSPATGVPSTQLELPNLDGCATGETAAADSSGNGGPPREPKAATDARWTVDNFLLGPSNQLAHTAMAMICQDPRAASPLFICGPTGTGKSHMLHAIADQFRRRHRMKRVLILSAEQFTNDFISSCGNTGITAFRRRYREVDALLIDGMQFLGAKTATLREMLYTVETLISSGRPLVASGITSPGEIQGLSGELSGRLAAGLVCPLLPIDIATRETLLRREIDLRCPLAMPDSTIQAINATLAGDGRIIRGVANLINTLQRMNGRVPSIDELRRYGGDLLRSAQPIATLPVIESAVCQAFGLPADTLRGGSQTRAVTEPRMLAMYLSRQLTSSAYTEIARHFGGRSHSTAISAEKNVKNWLASEKPIGRGIAAMSTQEALDRIESLLRTG